MSEGRVRLNHVGAVAWIIIDNQKRRNAMSLAMWRELGELLSTVGNEARCIVLRGAGDQAFVAGADISEFADQRRSPEDVASYDRTADAAMTALAEMPQPTVAMISGYCIGGGMALSLCCDIRLADAGSQFAIPAGRLGLGYGASGLKRLLDVVSVSVATDIMVSAERYSAAEALGMGLVNRIYPRDALLGEVEKYVTAVSKNAPLTIRAAKRTIKELARTSPAADLQRCNALIAGCFASQDYLEGIAAFVEKRTPHFTGS